MKRLKLISFLIVVVMVLTAMTSCKAQPELEDVVGTWTRVDTAENAPIAKTLNYIDFSTSSFVNGACYYPSIVSYYGVFSIHGEFITIQFHTASFGNFDIDSASKLANTQWYSFEYYVEKGVGYLKDDYGNIYRRK